MRQVGERVCSLFPQAEWLRLCGLVGRQQLGWRAMSKGERLVSSGSINRYLRL